MRGRVGDPRDGSRATDGGSKGSLLGLGFSGGHPGVPHGTAWHGTRGSQPPARWIGVRINLNRLPAQQQPGCTRLGSHVPCMPGPRPQCACPHQGPGRKPPASTSSPLRTRCWRMRSTASATLDTSASGCMCRPSTRHSATPPAANAPQSTRLTPRALACGSSGQAGAGQSWTGHTQHAYRVFASSTSHHTASSHARALLTATGTARKRARGSMPSSAKEMAPGGGRGSESRPGCGPVIPSQRTL